MVYDNSINYVKPTTYMTKSSTIAMYSTDQYQDLSKEEIEQLAEDEMNFYLQNKKIWHLKVY